MNDLFEPAPIIISLSGCPSVPVMKGIANTRLPFVGQEFIQAGSNQKGLMKISF